MVAKVGAYCQCDTPTNVFTAFLDNLPGPHVPTDSLTTLWIDSPQRPDTSCNLLLFTDIKL
jgi:hypothetical protein